MARASSSVAGSTGLTRCRSKPASFARHRSASDPQPVTATRNASMRSARNSRGTSHPFIPGSPVSRSTTSGRHLRAQAIAAGPWCSVVASYPALCRITASAWQRPGYRRRQLRPAARGTKSQGIQAAELMLCGENRALCYLHRLLGRSERKVGGEVGVLRTMHGNAAELAAVRISTQQIRDLPPSAFSEICIG